MNNINHRKPSAEELKRKQALHSKNGSILIVVLIMMAFLLSVGVLIYEKSSNSYGGVIGVQADNQGAIYAGTALTVIRSLMEYDDPEYDAPDDQWTAIPSIPVANGFVSVTITPADSRLPVNALAQTDEAKAKRIQDAFEKLFADQGYDGNLWRSLKDWVSDSAANPMSTEVTDVIFNQEGSSYTAKYAPLSSLYEIRLVPEFAGIYKDIIPYISMGDLEPKININFADNATISALLPELEPYLGQIMDMRSEGPFKTKDALYSLIGSSNREVYTGVLPFFDVKSTFFYVKIEVNILDTVQYYHALLKRNGKRFTVMRYIEGRSIDYF